MPETTGSFKALARARARSLTQWPLLVVIGIVTIGLVLVGLGYWHAGTATVGGGLLVGAGERAFLSRQSAGLLQVRSRLFDVSFMLVCGLGIIILAAVVPTP